MTIAQPSGEHKCPSWSDCGPSLRLSSKTLLAPCGSSLSPQTSSASHHLPILPEKCQTASDHSQLASTSGCGAVSSSSDADRLCLCKTRCATKRRTKIVSVVNTVIHRDHAVIKHSQKM